MDRSMVLTRIKIFSQAFIPLVLIVGGLFLWILHDNAINYRKKIIAEANSFLNLEVEVFDHTIASKIKDIRFLNQMVVKTLINDKISMAKKLDVLTETFYSFSKIHSRYDQIRYINDNGEEVVRINNRHGSPLIAPTKMLQNQKHRPYFNQTMQLPAGHIYISPLEANVEFGKVEIPIIPVMRVAMPITINNQNKGLVILNYNADLLIERLRTNLYKNSMLPMLINRLGYFIIGPTVSSEWGSIISERKNQTVEKLYPGAWQQMQKPHNKKIKTKSGLFLVRNLSASIEKHISNVFSKGIGLRIILFIPSKALRPEITYYIAMIFVVFILLLLSSFFWTIFRLKKLQYDIEMKKLATLDPLTQISNRNKLFENIKNEIERSKRLNQSLSLIMLDIDFFKKVNDRFGHIAGDEVLKVLTKNCGKLIRNIDTFGRFGGEEFVIVLPGTELNEAVNLAERICSETAKLKVPFQKESISFTISLGVATLHEDETTFEGMLNRSDKALYAAKNHGRNQVVGEDKI